MGQQQFFAYKNETSHSAIFASATVIRFESTLSRRNGLTALRLLLPDKQLIYFQAEIMDGNIPLFTRYRLYSQTLPGYKIQKRKRHLEWYYMGSTYSLQ